MRYFVVLCFIALAQADKLGYNYRPVEHSQTGLSFNPASAGTQPSATYIPSNPSTSASSQSADISAPSASLGLQSFSSPAASASAPASSLAAPSESSADSTPVQGIEKEFYTFSANDEDFLEPSASQQVDSLANQHLQVIFVKGPENSGLEDAFASLVQQASNRKTDIYVLNKQADLSELANKLNQLGDHSHSKPEVHFVKYRTPQDAENAQSQIQSQYDSLGGPSHAYSGGIAPAINFASAPEAKPQEAGAAASAPQASYLPASITKRLRL